MAVQTIVKYKFEQEHLQEYRRLLENLYGEHSHSQAFVETKIRIKQPENPFFQKGDIENFIAYNNSQPIAHIAAVTDARLTDSDGSPIGLIGFYECTQDEGLAKVLINKAITYLRGRYCHLIRGPIDLTTWHPYRFAIDQDSRTVFAFEPINQPFYPQQFKQAGFTQAGMYASLRRGDLETMLEYAARIQEPLSQAGFRIQRAYPENFSQTARLIHEMSNKIFIDNWSFIPLSFDEFSYLHGSDPQIANRAIIEILKNPKGEEIGFSFGVPDSLNNSLVLKSIGVLPEHRYTWGGVMLGGSQVQQAMDLGLKSIIFALRKREKITRSLVYQDSIVIREYVVFEMNLDS